MLVTLGLIFACCFLQVQDAQATMRLYTMVKKQWEAEIKVSRKNKFLDKRSERKAKLPKDKNHWGLQIQNKKRTDDLLIRAELTEVIKGFF